MRHEKREKTNQFARNPVNYFDRPAGTSQAVSGTHSLPLLYNYLAMDVIGSNQMEVEGFSFTPLTDACFRDLNSPRSHPIELLVTDHLEGLALIWRVDELITDQIRLPEWVVRCRAMLQDQVENPQCSTTTASIEDFPDSGMNADELSDFLDNLD